MSMEKKREKEKEKERKERKNNAGQGKWGGSGSLHFNVDTCRLPHFRSFSEESMEPAWNSR
ncbi:hypothetical protein LY76DRAFT_480549, partial [Colletotrichum caudatum]